MRIDEIAISYVMQNMNLLTEDRIQFLKDNTKKLSTEHDPHGEHKKPEDIIQHFADNGDPTKNKVHTQYLVNLYKSGKIRQEDTPQAHETLTNFEKYKVKLSPEDKQLNVKSYPKLSDVEDKIAPHVGTMASKKQAEKTLDQPGHVKKYEDDKIAIYHLKDAETSKNLYGGGHSRGGLGTSWCTAARSDDNRFNQYNKDGPMHVVHRKSDGAVFQYHPDSNQFQDAKNNEISHEDFKSISPSLHKAWEKHPEIL